MTLGEGGLITIAKRAKENMELAQIEEQERLNALYSQLEGETGEEIDYDIIAKLNNFKKAIADYIEEAGGIKPDYTADAETFGERIKGIVKEVTKDATATEEDILEGKIAYVNGNKIIGNLRDIGNPKIERGSFSGKSITLSGYKYIIITSYYYSDSNPSIASGWSQVNSCSGATAECIINGTISSRLSMSTNLITCTNDTCTIVYNMPQDRAIYLGIK